MADLSLSDDEIDDLLQALDEGGDPSLEGGMLDLSADQIDEAPRQVGLPSSDSPLPGLPARHTDTGSAAGAEAQAFLFPPPPSPSR